MPPPTITATTTTTTIRTRNPSDLPYCASLLARVYASDGYPVQGVSHAVEFLSSPSTLEAWVAEETATTTTTTTNNKISNLCNPTNKPSPNPKRILGHVSLTSPSPTSTDPAVTLWRSQHPSEPIAGVAVLERLFVDPATRGQGLAAKLLQTASEEAGKRGLQVVLFALVKDSGAMRLYERAGWREFGRRMFGYTDGEGAEREMEAVCFVGPERSSSY
ncbi:hypothetical protein MBLNU13_g07450t1 [Cladosporium sp. NU13]